MPKKRPPPTLDELLEKIPNRPDPKVFGKRRYMAKATKKSLFHFLFDLFMWNEIVPREKRRTDGGIAAVVLAEFPNHTSLRKNLDSEKHGINYYRQLFNTGRLSKGQPAPYVSFRYDMQGNRISSRTGKSLSAREQKALLERYRSKFLKKQQLTEEKATSTKLESA